MQLDNLLATGIFTPHIAGVVMLELQYFINYQNRSSTASTNKSTKLPNLIGLSACTDSGKSSSSTKMSEHGWSSEATAANKGVYAASVRETSSKLTSLVILSSDIKSINHKLLRGWERG